MTVICTPLEEYLHTTSGSRALYEQAARYMPGGTTRTSIFFRPYPLYLDRGAGCRVWDVDGTERLDLISNYTAVILGHAHPAVVGAVQEQIERGSAFGAANALQVELAELLCRRVPSIEQVRFTNSGTEATMFAMRVARAFTGRSKIARIEGGYHGSHDYAQVSTRPELSLAGPADCPTPLPDSLGIPSDVVDSAVVLPFNDPEAADRILSRHCDEVAALIVEPILGSGGCIPAARGYLEALRAITRRLDILLIFDEVISFRVAPGGMQELSNVTPDLTALGKLVGGGLPVAAFGGRAEVMRVLDPQTPGSLPHAGSFNGNPLGMAAGLATLKALTPSVYRDLNDKGAWIRTQLRRLFEEHGVPAQITGAASLFNIHFTDRPVRNHRDTRTADPARVRRFVLALLNNGALLSQRCMGALSTAVGTPELEQFLECVDRVLAAEAMQHG